MSNIGIGGAWLYVMVSHTRPIAKVGLSQRLEQRLRQVAQREGDSLRLVASVWCPTHRRALNAELRAHRHLRRHSHHNEWFRWSNDVERFVGWMWRVGEQHASDHIYAKHAGVAPWWE
jgi:hypothetical protein